MGMVEGGEEVVLDTVFILYCFLPFFLPFFHSFFRFLFSFFAASAISVIMFSIFIRQDVIVTERDLPARSQTDVKVPIISFSPSASSFSPVLVLLRLPPQ